MDRRTAGPGPRIFSRLEPPRGHAAHGDWGGTWSCAGENLKSHNQQGGTGPRRRPSFGYKHPHPHPTGTRAGIRARAHTSSERPKTQSGHFEPPVFCKYSTSNAGGGCQWPPYMNRPRREHCRPMVGLLHATVVAWKGPFVPLLPTGQNAIRA